MPYLILAYLFLLIAAGLLGLVVGYWLVDIARGIARRVGVLPSGRMKFGKFDHTFAAMIRYGYTDTR